MLHGWRIASPEFSDTHKQMMNGEGAYLYGGRWNNKGTRVVYLGSSMAMASMELLVHIARSDVLKDYRICRVSFDESMMEHISLDDLPDDWYVPTMASSVQVVGDDWVADGSSLILEVPSAVLLGEYNYLLNPAHPDFDQIEFSPIEPYRFDVRLLK